MAVDTDGGTNGGGENVTERGLPTDRWKLFPGGQNKHSSCSFACPAFRSTSVSSALAYAHPDDAAQYAAHIIQMLLSNTPHFLPSLSPQQTPNGAQLHLRAFPGKLRSNVGSPPVPFQCLQGGEGVQAVGGSTCRWDRKRGGGVLLTPAHCVHHQTQCTKGLPAG
ncbi:hypothetical protein NQZ68_031582 [Dissostichus eleginoides]|nr:hypothetical protein NQZ68_031582 [Dissostichus eleginoides]